MTYETVTGGILRAIGVFYAAGSLIVIWGTLTSAVAERAMAAVEVRTLPPAAIWRTWWLLGSAVLLLICGLALALLVKPAVPLFALSAASQAFYLQVLAPRYFDKADKPSDIGRQRTRNALLVFCVATALVVAAWSAGWLLDWQAIPPAILTSAVGIVAFVVAYIVSNMRAPR